MKDIHEYVKNYGKYTFLEKEFNEVDNVIFSLLSYVDFFNIIPMMQQGSITLKNASKKFYSKHDKKDIDRQILPVREAWYLLGELAEAKRYKDLELLNYEYNVTFDMQFGALCVKLPDKSMYVSYEGTDNYVSGWKEDFMMSYVFPTNAQIEAVNYLNKVVGLFSHKIYVGGHSKGGNLAVIAATYCKRRVFRKIVNVYCNDGPGVRVEQLVSKKYNKMSSKLIQIVPRESFVGMLLYHQENYTVINSYKRYFLQHDALNWMIEDDHFVRCELSEFSKKIEKSILLWLKKYNDKEKEELVNVLFNILSKAEIDDLTTIKQAKITSILKILKEMKNISKEHRNILTRGFMLLYSEWREQ